MKVFRLFLKLLYDYRGTILAYTLIFIAIFAALTVGATEESGEINLYNPKIAVFDHDDSPLSRHLAAYLLSRSTEVKIEEDAAAIDDAIFEDWLNYAIAIPEGFEDSFGKSGNLAAVPPKAATIGPADVINAKHRFDTHAISVHGTTTAWQRFISRLVLHGPVTPLVPESILQTLSTEVYVSETIAQNIETDWNKGY